MRFDLLFRVTGFGEQGSRNLLPQHRASLRILDVHRPSLGQLSKFVREGAYPLKLPRSPVANEDRDSGSFLAAHGHPNDANDTKNVHTTTRPVAGALGSESWWSAAVQ